MTRRCEQLREQALRHGLDSKAGLAWRIHSRACEHCRMSLFLLEALEQQADRERQHLGHDEVTTLLTAVRQQHLRPHPGRAILSWLTPLTALLALLISIGWFVGGRTLLTPVWNTARIAMELHRGILPEEQSLTNCMSPAIEARLRQVRRQITTRRNRVLRMIEVDLGEPPASDGRYEAPPA